MYSVAELQKLMWFYSIFNTVHWCILILVFLRSDKNFILYIKCIKEQYVGILTYTEYLWKNTKYAEYAYVLSVFKIWKHTICNSKKNLSSWSPVNLIHCGRREKLFCMTTKCFHVCTVRSHVQLYCKCDQYCTLIIVHTVSDTDQCCKINRNLDVQQDSS